MNDLQKQFLAESAGSLKTLIENSARDFSENQRIEAFRLVHTIKGTAQVLGLPDSSKIAHELENLLSRPEISADENLRTLLVEGLGLLIDALDRSGFDPAASFFQKLEEKNRGSAPQSDILLTQIPPDVFKKFSETEKNAALVALRQKKKVLCAEVGFERADFAARYRALRKTLGEKGTVIAALPSAKFGALGKIGFQIFLASDISAEDLQKTIEDFPGEIISHTCSEDSAGHLYEMLSRLTFHAENLAEISGKKTEITVLASDARLSPALTKTIFDILLHLVRNAVDHAIEQAGKIEIHLLCDNETVNLMVADNGKGVALEKIRAGAIAKNLISAEDDLNEQQTLELIFAPEVSSAQKISEISGRGVGLAAVRDLVEKKGGKISVKSRKSIGTIFEIFLPLEYV